LYVDASEIISFALKFIVYMGVVYIVVLLDTVIFDRPAVGGGFKHTVKCI
jgi:hypothetical protein